MFHISYDLEYAAPGAAAKLYRVLAIDEDDARERFEFRIPRGIIRSVKFVPTLK
jgi:hypothetical protein